MTNAGKCLILSHLAAINATIKSKLLGKPTNRQYVG